jgi:hypothetical protein
MSNGRMVQVSETTLAAIEARHAALESRIEKQDERIDNLVENVNLLRGDQQRIDAANAPARKGGRFARVSPEAAPDPRA